jgi:preprotein translocase subunit SecF
MLIILEIAVVLVCGLVGDLISTWFFNAPALISYVNKKKK